MFTPHTYRTLSVDVLFSPYDYLYLTQDHLAVLACDVERKYSSIE